jgi:hypothetical protein
MTKKKSATKKSTAKKPAAGKKAGAKKSAVKRAVVTRSTVKKSVAIPVRTKRSTLTFLTESLPGFAVGRAVKNNTRIQAIGGTPPYSFGLSQGSALPAGLSLDYQGTFSGRPTQSGDTTIFVKVIDFVGNHVTQAFDVQVS